MATGFTKVMPNKVTPEQVLLYFNYDITNVLTNCPFHEDNTPSLQINSDYVYCHACGKSADTLSLTCHLGDMEPQEAGKWLQTTEFGAATIKKKRAYCGPLHTNIVEYWHTALLNNPIELERVCADRLITVETVKKYKLGYRPDNHAIAIPFIIDGRVDSIQFRALKDDALTKYYGLSGYSRGSVMNADLLTTPQEYIVVLLGTFDSITARSDGVLAVGVNGSTPFGKKEKSRVQEMFKLQDTIYVVPDNTPAEYTAAQTLANWLGGKVRYFPKDSPKDCDYIDYRKLGNTPQDFINCVLDSVPYQQPPSNLISNLVELLKAGDKQNLSQYFWIKEGRGFSARDIALSIAQEYPHKPLYGVKCEEDLVNVFNNSYRLQGGW